MPSYPHHPWPTDRVTGPGNVRHSGFGLGGAPRQFPLPLREGMPLLYVIKAELKRAERAEVGRHQIPLSLFRMHVVWLAAATSDGADCMQPDQCRD